MTFMVIAFLQLLDAHSRLAPCWRLEADTTPREDPAARKYVYVRYCQMTPIRPKLGTSHASLAPCTTGIRCSQLVLRQALRATSLPA